MSSCPKLGSAQRNCCYGWMASNNATKGPDVRMKNAALPSTVTPPAYLHNRRCNTRNRAGNPNSPPSRYFLDVDYRCNDGFLKRITYTITPYTTVIRPFGVVQNPANGFPARPLEDNHLPPPRESLVAWGSGMTSSQRHPPDRARAVNTRNRQIWLTRDRRHSEFPFRVLEVNHIIMRSGGG